MHDDPTGNPGGVMGRWSTIYVQDVVNAENCDYNWCYNGATDDGNYGYLRGTTTNHMFSSGTPDASTGPMATRPIRVIRSLSTPSAAMPLYDTKKLGTTAAQGTWTTSTGV